MGTRGRWHQSASLSVPPAVPATGTGPGSSRVPLALSLSLPASRRQPRASVRLAAYFGPVKDGPALAQQLIRCATRMLSRRAMRRVSQSLPNTSLAPRTALTPFPTLRPMPHALCELHAGHQPQQPLAQQPEPSPAKFQARPAVASPQPYQACLKLNPLRLRLKHIKLASSASAT